MSKTTTRASFVLTRPNSKQNFDNVKKEARDLILQLEHLNDNYKDKSPDKEKQRDYIFKRLYKISKFLEKNKHCNGLNKECEDLYFSITSSNLNDVKTISSDNLHQYGDVYKLFLKENPSIKYSLFLEEISKKLGVKNPTVKKVVYNNLDNCNRKGIFKNLKKNTCQTCWDEVMYKFFMSSAKTFLVELKSQTENIERAYVQQKISLKDAEDISKMIEKITIKFHKLLEKINYSEINWIKSTEKLFLLIVNLSNEILFKYTNYAIRQKSIQDSNIKDLIDG